MDKEFAFLLCSSIILIIVLRITYVSKDIYLIEVGRRIRLSAFPVMKHHVVQPRLLVMYYINIFFDVPGIVLWIINSKIGRYYGVVWGTNIVNSILIGCMVEDIIRIKKEKERFTVQFILLKIIESICAIFVWVYPFLHLLYHT